MSAARYLVDKSALTRLPVPSVAGVLRGQITSGVVAISIVTELEMGFSAQSAADYRETRDVLVRQLLSVAMPVRAEGRAREVQAALVDRGQDRSAGVDDLLVAAAAEIEGLTVLHYDADFDLIAEVTGQPMEWIVPRRSL